MNDYQLAMHTLAKAKAECSFLARYGQDRQYRAALEALDRAEVEAWRAKEAYRKSKEGQARFKRRADADYAQAMRELPLMEVEA